MREDVCGCCCGIIYATMLRYARYDISTCLGLSLSLAFHPCLAPLMRLDLLELGFEPGVCFIKTASHVGGFFFFSFPL